MIDDWRGMMKGKSGKEKIVRMKNICFARNKMTHNIFTWQSFPMKSLIIGIYIYIYIHTHTHRHT